MNCCIANFSDGCACMGILVSEGIIQHSKWCVIQPVHDRPRKLLVTFLLVAVQRQSVEYPKYGDQQNLSFLVAKEISYSIRRPWKWLTGAETAIVDVSAEDIQKTCHQNFKINKSKPKIQFLLFLKISLPFSLKGEDRIRGLRAGASGRPKRCLRLVKSFCIWTFLFLKLPPSFDTKGVSPNGNFLYKMRTLRSEKTCIILKDGKLLTSFSQSESQPIWCPGFVQKLNQLGSSVELLEMFWRTAAKETQKILNDSIKLQSYYYHHDRLYWITWYNVHWYSM